MKIIGMFVMMSFSALVATAGGMQEFDVGNDLVQGATSNNDCDQHPEFCTEASCNQISRMECDDTDEILEVQRACQGNYDGGCVTEACRWAGSFSCDRRAEVVKVAIACRGNRGGGCINTLCKRLGSMKCDSLDEIIKIAQACATLH